MIFVTGGTGLIGSHLLYKLVCDGKTPIALKRTTSDIKKTAHVFSYYSQNADTLFNRITWVDGDILDYVSLSEILDNIDYVYHCAAAVSFQSSDKQSLKEINVTGTTNIVNSCLDKGVKKLVHVSSIGTLGRAESNGLVTEETHWNNKKTSAYSTSKYHAEMEVWRGIAEGLNAVIVNPSIVLGPGDWNNGSSRLFKTVYNGLKFYTGGTNGFVDVNDVVDSMIDLMYRNVDGERFIINSENVSYKDLFTWMADNLRVSPPEYKATPFMSEIGWRILWLKSLLTGKKSTITKETAETANQRYQYSNEKIKSTTGINFIPVKESVDTNSKLFLHDHNK